jgi:stage V sporulation protein R
MELISQHAKRIMEGCKERARQAGLRFEDETLEYIVTNRDLLELGPKIMIPTLYDYWVQEVEVLREQGRYELYPNNPYETVINTRPPISYYNDNNPDWLNVMIFYHVIGHIDFFQNNLFFRHTWDYDFTGRALADKRLFAKLRSEKGRWVDYVIEFARTIDNLVGYFDLLGESGENTGERSLRLLDYYFDIFLQRGPQSSVSLYSQEIARYNRLLKEHPEDGESRFLKSVTEKHAELEALYGKKLKEKKTVGRTDLLHFLMEYSPFLNREENRWMLMILEVIRSTSLYFQPQIRTKILNEGWASYWHDTLFLGDDRIKGHEIDYAIVNAKVTSMPRVGLNPYALGMRLFQYLEQQAERGRTGLEYFQTTDRQERQRFDRATGKGRKYIFSLRENYCDSMFINSFIDQDFIDQHRLFVVGKRMNKERMTWQYYVRSRKAADYKQMVADGLYHPPRIEVGVAENNTLVLEHVFEGKPLLRDFIQGVMLGVEYLWGGEVHLHTSVPIPMKAGGEGDGQTKEETPKRTINWKRFRYTMKDRTLSRALVE